METRTNSLNFTSESLNVVVLERKPSKFQQQWLFLFRSELSLILSQLQPTARALLLDALILGSINPQGLICVPSKALVARQIGRGNSFDALSRLEQLNLIRRADGLVYLSPKLAYRGRTSEWGLALRFWSTLLAEEGTNES
jgi:hypothetical protein